MQEDFFSLNLAFANWLNSRNGGITDMSSVEDRVKKIVVEQLGVKEEEVTSEASFVDDLLSLIHI